MSEHISHDVSTVGSRLRLEVVLADNRIRRDLESSFHPFLPHHPPVASSMMEELGMTGSCWQQRVSARRRSSRPCRSPPELQDSAIRLEQLRYLVADLAERMAAAVVAAEERTQVRH